MSRTSLAPLMALTLAACSLAPAPEPPAPVETLPEAWENVEVPGTYAPSGWWRSFADPTLDTLLAEALVENLDLREAVARVQEARAALGIATSPLFPAVTATGTVSQSSNPNNTGFGRQIFQLLAGLSGDSTSGGSAADSTMSEPPDRFTNTTWSTSIGVSYELDFWGRLRNDRSAAAADLAAGEADLHTARLAVLATAISTWFEYVDLRTRLELTSEIVGVLQERTELAESRYDRGLASSFELYQVRQELRNTQSALPQLRTALADAESRLAILTARYPAELRELIGDTSPEVSLAPIPAGLPSDLLLQRPDVRSAAARYEAARLRVGARRADLLPSLNLSGSLGLQSNDAGSLFDLSQWVRNLAAGLTAPIFQGGRLRANLSAAEARYAQAGAAYARAVLTAYGEVDVALLRMREERDRLDFLESQLDEAEASVDLQSRRYASGVAGYTDYLDALRARLQTESTLVSARRDFALARLAVHRALGGGWVEPSEPTSDRP